MVCTQLCHKVGKKVNIDSDVIFYNMRQSEIGDYSGIGMKSYIGLVRIGRHVMIGPELMALSRNHRIADLKKPMREQGRKADRRIVIEDDVWIGGRVILLPGISVGRGAVVGAGSVVTKDVPPFSIVAGNPAKIVGKRTERKDD